MSGLVADVKKSAKSKKERLFGIRLLQGAIADVKAGEPGSMVARTFSYDKEVTEGLEKRLGPIFRYVNDACMQITKEFPQLALQSPGKTVPPQQFSVTVTTTASIWKLLDDNERWKRAQGEAFKTILDERVTNCGIKVSKAGDAVKEDAAKYITIANILQAEPDKIYLDSINDGLAVFATEIRQQIAACEKWTGINFASWMTGFIREQKNAEKAIIQVRVAKSGAVVLDSGLIAGHAAHAAASFGATAPLAIIAIVRQSLDIVNIVGKAAMRIDSLAKVISKEIKLVVNYYAADKPAAVGTEIVLNAVKGVLGVDVPSVATCNEHITEYEHKIRTLSSSYNQLQRELADMKRVLDGYKQLMKFDEAKGMTADQRREWIALIASVTKSYLALEASGDDKDRRIDEAEKNVVDWRETLSTIEEKTGKWQKYVAKGVALATSAGLGLGHVGGEAIDGAAAAVEHTHKLLIEMGTVLTEGFADPLLDRLREAES
jgi:hypothetical protein